MKGPNGNTQILKHTTQMRGKEVHLKFTSGSHYMTNNHYEAMLLLKKHVDMNTKDEMTINSMSQHLGAANKPR